MESEGERCTMEDRHCSRAFDRHESGPQDGPGDSELFDVGVGNTNSLLDKFEGHETVSDFLHADLHVPVHCTAVSRPQDCLEYTYDVDGVVFEFDQMQCLKGGLHYLLLPVMRSLTPHYHFLKKHVDLKSCSRAGIAALRHAVGHTIGYVDGGFHLALTAVPASLTQPDVRIQGKEAYSAYALELLNGVRREFQKLLRGAPAKDLCRPTLQKQTSRDTSKYNVLRQDISFILFLLNQAIEKANECELLKVRVFMNMFGQKDVFDLVVEEFLDPLMLRSMSVHLACKIVAKDPAVHIMFSRYGLQQLVGHRGTLFSTLGFHEAANFQSNMEGMGMDIGEDLRGILGREGTLTFLQLYVDSPHVHLRTPFKHPVSGAVVTCGLSHTNCNAALYSRAHAYLCHMRDLRQRLVCQLGCRIEQVVRFEGDIPLMVSPAEHFDFAALQSLLERHALIVPFKTTRGGKGLLSTLDSVLQYLLDTLQEAFTSSQGVGRFDASWKAYQVELALEELFFGRPLSPLDFPLSVSLGTNTVSDKSLTNHRGVLGLSPYTRASSEETPPPLHNWTRSELQKTRIERLFPFCQTLEAGPVVVGTALVTVLLGDIYRKNTGLPMSALRSDTPPGRLIGPVPLETFCKDLANQNSFPPPCTFARARTLAEQAGKDVEECLLKGFVEHKLVFFPAVKFRDFRGTRTLWWNWKDYVQLHLESQPPSTQSTAASRTLEVCMELERRGLAFSGPLEKYRDHGMIWMDQIISRLPPNLPKVPKIFLGVLTYLSCVGMIMNGDYVDYSHLKDLLQEISPTMSQRKLQELQVLSKFTLPKVYHIVVWKLHESIPYRMPTSRPGLKQKAKEVHEDSVQPEEDVQAVDDQDGIKPMERSDAKYLPAKTSKVWSVQEVALIDLNPGVKDKASYQRYCESCWQNGMAARRFDAFRHKRKNLIENASGQ